MSTLSTILILAACMFAAYKLVNWLWPIIEQRNQLTPLQMLQRALAAHDEARERQATVLGSRRKTIAVGLVNLVLIFGWMAFAASPLVLWLGVGYQCIGHLVMRAMQIQIAAPAGLKFHNRVWLHIFYAWFWPMYLAYGRK